MFETAQNSKPNQQECLLSRNHPIITGMSFTKGRFDNNIESPFSHHKYLIHLHDANTHCLKQINSQAIKPPTSTNNYRSRHRKKSRHNATLRSTSYRYIQKKHYHQQSSHTKHRRQQENKISKILIYHFLVVFLRTFFISLIQSGQFRYKKTYKSNRITLRTNNNNNEKQV